MTSFDAFWGSYLHAHSRPATRGIHYFATVLGLSGGISSVIWLDPWPVLGAVAGAYVLAVSAHWFIERNQPLIMANPLWGAVADVRMCLLAMTGRLAQELERHHVAQGGARPSVPGEESAGTPAAPGQLESGPATR